MVRQPYTHGTAPVTGVLITNLGSPEAPTAGAVRRFLAEFLSDVRVVDYPRLLWWLILHGVILRIRPRIAAHSYKLIWTEQGSPLIAISKKQHTALQNHLDKRFKGQIKVALGMRYGKPSIHAALQELRDAGVQRILLFPLYPQYSSTTTASTFDAVAAELKHWRWVPELRVVNHYHDDPGYIDALVNSIRREWEKRAPAEKLMFSFHGLPKRLLAEGDPYSCECYKTARLVAEELELADDAWQLTFQSRFGREEWMQPYSDRTLVEWAKSGIESVDVVCPGFSADCLETLEEADIQNRELFISSGGKEYHYIPALNDQVDHIYALGSIVMKHTQGWDVVANEAEQAASRALAMATGALD